MKKSFMWSPWHGCHKISPGCKNCYVYFLDNSFGKDASEVKRNITNFLLPTRLNRKKQYEVPPKSIVYTCFTSDFFIEEADQWRDEAWDIIKKRPDVLFVIATKRIDRFLKCVPADWGEGYLNVCVAVSCENQILADRRIPILLNLPIRHKCVFVSPILERVNIEKYLETKMIEKVSVSGESYDGARECDFDWILDLREQCKRQNVSFSFHQTGSNFIKNGKNFKISHYKEYEQAKKAGLDLKTKPAI